MQFTCDHPMTFLLNRFKPIDDVHATLRDIVSLFHPSHELLSLTLSTCPIVIKFYLFRIITRTLWYVSRGMLESINIQGNQQGKSNDELVD